MNETKILEGLNALSEVDADVEAGVALIGAPPPRIRPAGFETFLNIIVSQQLSTESARAIMGRLQALLPEMNANALLAQEPQSLRDAGLSFRKIEYAQGLAEAVKEGRFDIDGLVHMTDEKAVESITALRGFGRWSAEIYLMFSLQRQDIFPADDLAIQVALGRLKGLEKKPTPKQARNLIEHWAPWRSVGSLFLWHYYRGAPA